MIGVVVMGPVRIYRDTVAAALNRHEGVQVLAVAGSSAEAVAWLRGRRADVVLADATTSAGIRAVEALSVAAPSVKVVALAGADDGWGVIACAEAGVSGFVTCEGTVDDVADAASAVARGESACSPTVAATVLRRVGTVARHNGEPTKLTPREREILALIDDGLSNKEIAADLSIEVSTVKNHVHNILGKLGARRRSEAVARARTRFALRPMLLRPTELV
jgi:two-component system, NarL family, nitrate/nitrite response regulator NarL